MFIFREYILLVLLIHYSACSGDEVNLYSVDRTIVRLLSKPTYGSGEFLFNSIQLYNKTLKHIVTLFLRKDMKVATIAEILWERNGPRFLVKRMDDIVLQNTYDWTITDLTIMYDLLNETQDIWRELRLEYSKMLTKRLQQEGLTGDHNKPQTMLD